MDGKGQSLRLPAVRNSLARVPAVRSWLRVRAAAWRGLAPDLRIGAARCTALSVAFGADPRAGVRTPASGVPHLELHVDAQGPVGAVPMRSDRAGDELATSTVAHNPGAAMLRSQFMRLRSCSAA